MTTDDMDISKPVSVEEAYERLTTGCGWAVVEGVLPALGPQVVFVKNENIARPEAILDLPTYTWPGLKQVWRF